MTATSRAPFTTEQSLDVVDLTSPLPGVADLLQHHIKIATTLKFDFSNP